MLLKWSPSDLVLGLSLLALRQRQAEDLRGSYTAPLSDPHAGSTAYALTSSDILS
jgi:hypothetical protein